MRKSGRTRCYAYTYTPHPPSPHTQEKDAAEPTPKEIGAEKSDDVNSRRAERKNGGAKRQCTVRREMNPAHDASIANVRAPIKAYLKLTDREHETAGRSEQPAPKAELELLQQIIDAATARRETMMRQHVLRTQRVHLARSLDNTFPNNQFPPHVLGGPALLRWLTDYSSDATKVLEVLLPALRKRAQKGEAVPGEADVSLAAVAGVAALHEASWNTHHGISADKRGDIVVYEDWGGIEPDEFCASACADLEVFRQIMERRFELLHVLLEYLSRTEERLVRYTVVINCKGMTMASHLWTVLSFLCTHAYLFTYCTSVNKSRGLFSDQTAPQKYLWNQKNSIN